MLVLTRKIGEEIIIGDGSDGLRIRVLDIHGSKVRIGFEGPRHVKILRSECWVPVESEREQFGDFDPTLAEVVRR